MYWVLDRADRKADTKRKAEPKGETKAEPKAETEPKPVATPARVERVHEFYEELGREDVRAVQDWDKKHQAGEVQKDHPTK